MGGHAGVAGHDLIAWVAAAVLVTGGGVFLAAAARARPGGIAVARPYGGPAGGTGTAILAGLSVGAGLIHLVAAPGHFAEIGDLAAGFLAAGAFQLAWGRAAFAARGRPISTRMRRLGLAGNTAILGAWAVARTVGVPLGHVDPVALPDAAASTFEALVVAGLAAWVLRTRHGRRNPVVRVPRLGGAAAVAAVPLLGLVVILTSLATLVIVAGADHGIGPAHIGPGAPH